MRWEGFRKVRGQVCKRIGRRLRELDLPDADAYTEYLEAHREEWAIFDSLCRVTISRFHRDRGVWDLVGGSVLPDIARAACGRGEKELRCWSAGCASGEEAYTLSIVWHLAVRRRFPGVNLRILATDADARLLGRAREGCYAGGSLRELPARWRAEAFEERGDGFHVRAALREPVTFLRQEIRRAVPAGPFHLILCRNLVFTYFEESLQREVLLEMAGRMAPYGALVVGVHERLPPCEAGLLPWFPKARIYRRREATP
jgi:chemotaxis protein methyltransferase CheR